MTSLPTADEINVFDSLDERCAVEHFLGKSLADAEALFREDSLTYQEDLMEMGPKAFCFYVRAAINYVKSESAKGDSDIVSCLYYIVSIRLEEDREDVWPVVDQLRDFVEYVIDNWSKFEVDPKIYGDLHARYQTLLAQLSRR